MGKTISLLVMCAMITSFCAINVAAQVPESLNLVVNGDFENGVAGWSAVGADVTVTSAEGVGFGDSDCAEVSSSNKVNGDVRAYMESLKTAKKGEKYYISIKVKMKEAGKTAKARLAWGRSDKNQYYLNNSTADNIFKGTSAEFSIANEWITITDIFTVQEDNTNILTPFFFLRFTTEEQGAYYIDDFEIKNISDGNNLVLNANFDEGVKNWKGRNTTPVAVKDEGSSYARVTLDTTVKQEDLMQPIDILKKAGVGDTYYVTAKVKVESTDATATTASLILGGWEIILGDTAVTNSEWKQLSAIYTVDATTQISKTEGIWVRFKDSDNANTSFLVDDVAVVKVKSKDEPNMLLNSNFDLGTTLWDIRNEKTSGAATYTAQETGGFDNSACIMVSKTGYLGDIRQFVTVEEEHKYFVSVKVKLETGTTTNAKLLYYYYDGSTTQGIVVAENRAVGNDGWVTIEGILTVPTGCTNKGEIAIRPSNSDVGAAFIDDAYMIDITNIDTTYGINFNAGFEYGLAGWSYTASNATPYVISEGVAEGNNCVKVVGKTVAPDIRSEYPFVAGKTYVVSAKFKAEAATADSPVYPQFYCNGKWRGVVTPITNTEWVEINTTFVAQASTVANGTAVMFRQRNSNGTDNAPAGYTYYVDDYSIREVDNAATGVWHEAAFTGSAKEVGTLAADVELYNSKEPGISDNYAFLALYDADGKLVACDYEDGLNVTGEAVLKTTLTVPVEEADADAYAKVFVWNKDFAPYGSHIELNK